MLSNPSEVAELNPSIFLSYAVVFSMLQNHTCKRVKYQGCWDYHTGCQDHCSAPGGRLSKRHNIYCLYQIVQFNNLSHSYTPESGFLIQLIYSPAAILINMMKWAPYGIDVAWCSIHIDQVRRPNYCSNEYKMHHIRVFENLDEPVKHNQPNNEHTWTLLESPLRILELENVTPIAKSYAFSKWLIFLS